MVETPAAAVPQRICWPREADFLSIGTNDLTQYVRSPWTAAIRSVAGSHRRASSGRSAPDRADLSAGAASHHRWVGVCGGAASDLTAVPILLGLGVTELSATAAVVPEVKALVRSLDLEACRALAADVLDLTAPEAVRERARSFLAGV